MFSKNIENIAIYFLSSLFFILLLPYFIWPYPIIRHFVEICFVLISLHYIDFSRNGNKLILSILLLLLSFYLQLKGTSATSHISNLYLLLIFNIKDNVKIKLFKAILNVFAIAIGISLIVYVIVCWLKIPVPGQIIEPLNPVKLDNYIKYPFLVTYDSVYGFANMRFYGLFDEPGVVGTLCTLFLYSNYYRFNSWQYVVIFIAGLFSFSFFFYVMSFFFLFKKQSLKYIALAVLCLFLIITIFNEFFITNYEVFDKLIFSRFTSDGDYGGNRVNSLFAVKYIDYLQTFDIFWGRGSSELNLIAEGGSSYKFLIYSNGIVWFIFLCAFFVINVAIISRNTKVRFYSTLAFLGVLYQRPNVLDLPYFFIFITIPLVLQEYEKVKHEEQYCINNCR